MDCLTMEQMCLTSFIIKSHTPDIKEEDLEKNTIHLRMKESIVATSVIFLIASSVYSKDTSDESFQIKDISSRGTIEKCSKLK